MNGSVWWSSSLAPRPTPDLPYIERRNGDMCCLEDFGVDVTIAAADAVACRCVPGACLVDGARRLKRLMVELPDAEGDWVLEATEAGGDVD